MVRMGSWIQLPWPLTFLVIGRITTCRYATDLEPATCCLGDDCPSSVLYGPVGSSQVRLGGVSAESGLVRFSCGLWNDWENDQQCKLRRVQEERIGWRRPERGVIGPFVAEQMSHGGSVTQPNNWGGCATLISDTSSGRLLGASWRRSGGCRRTLVSATATLRQTPSCSQPSLCSSRFESSTGTRVDQRFKEQ